MNKGIWVGSGKDRRWLSYTEDAQKFTRRVGCAPYPGGKGSDRVRCVNVKVRGKTHALQVKRVWYSSTGWQFRIQQQGKTVATIWTDVSTSIGYDPRLETILEQTGYVDLNDNGVSLERRFEQFCNRL